MIEASVMDMAGFDDNQRKLLQITWKMLNAIETGDSDTYAALCMDDLTCYEDVCAYRIDGVEFHIDLIKLMAENQSNRPYRFDMLHPQVQIYPGCGIVTYTRLLTHNNDGKPVWRSFNETRVFIDFNGEWKMAHFHRSPV